MDHLSPAGEQFLCSIRRPDNLAILRRQARALIGASWRDVGLIVALLAAMAPQELRCALDQLGWADLVAEMDAAEAKERAKFAKMEAERATKILEAELRSDPATLTAVLSICAEGEGRAMVADHYNVTRHALAAVLKRIAPAPSGAVR